MRKNRANGDVEHVTAITFMYFTKSKYIVHITACQTGHVIHYKVYGRWRNPSQMALFTGMKLFTGLVYGALSLKTMALFIGAMALIAGTAACLVRTKGRVGNLAARGQNILYEMLTQALSGYPYVIYNFLTSFELEILVGLDQSTLFLQPTLLSHIFLFSLVSGSFIALSGGFPRKEWSVGPPWPTRPPLLTRTRLSTYISITGNQKKSPLIPNHLPKNFALGHVLFARKRAAPLPRKAIISVISVLMKRAIQFGHDRSR